MLGAFSVHSVAPLSEAFTNLAYLEMNYRPAVCQVSLAAVQKVHRVTLELDSQRAPHLEHGGANFSSLHCGNPMLQKIKSQKIQSLT
jgi:hypothetical protein